jgi:hypothetical protein
MDVVDEVSGEVGLERDLKKQVMDVEAQVVKHGRVNGMRSTQRMMRIARNICWVG